MRSVWISLLLSLFLVTAVQAQSVTQSGTVTPGHPAKWITNGVVGDGGSTTNGSITGIGIKAQGDGLCQITAPISGQYYKLCLGVSGTQGYLSFSAVNGASQLPLNFVVNGSTVSPGGSVQVAPGQVASNYTTTNPASITGNNWMAAGTSCPAYLSLYQMFANTTSAPTGTTINSWDGSQCIAWATLNATAHTFTVAAASLPAATSSALGAVEPDNVTITVNGSGVITAVGASATSIDAGGATSITNGTNSELLYQTSSGKVGVQTIDSIIGVTSPIAKSGTNSLTLSCTAGTDSASGCLKGDGGATVSITAGALALNLGHANTWTAVQTFTNSDLALLGSSTGKTTFTSANAGASNFTLTIPAVTDTMAVLGSQTFTGTETFSGTLNVSGTFQIAGNAMTFPGTADTIPGIGTANTFTNTNTFSGVSVFTRIRVNVRNKAADYTINADGNDYAVCVDSSAAVRSITMPANPSTGDNYWVGDCVGSAATNNITLHGNTGGANINGSATQPISNNYGGFGLTFNGTQWVLN